MGETTNLYTGEFTGFLNHQLWSHFSEGEIFDPSLRAPGHKQESPQHVVVSRLSTTIYQLHLSTTQVSGRDFF